MKKEIETKVIKPIKKFVQIIHFNEIKFIIIIFKLVKIM
jgi:hypothetical protein